ncbi:MAG: hypothetical protein E6K53_14745 [Gammaproteobacteria bacterium]|nr:MAG: hypothetical protein E6K53_14745 [Gammaproteobacteria bacterium]
MKSAPAIAFDYAPSRWLTRAMVAAAMLALAAIALCGLAVWIKLVLICATLAYAVWALRAFRRAAFDHVTWHATGHWRVRDIAGAEHIAEFVHASVRGRLHCRCSPTTAMPRRIGSCVCGLLQHKFPTSHKKAGLV